MPALSLTARTVLNLKPSRVRVDYFDDDPAGFGLRIAPSGKRTWFYLYRNAQGRQRRMFIGHYPALSLAEARDKAKDARHELEDGHDPGEARREVREADTFGELAADFLKKHRKRNGEAKISQDEDERIIDKELLPHWRHRLAKEITRRDVKILIAAIAERPAPVMANRVLALISTIFNFALDDEVVEANPAYRLKKPGAETTRERVLTEDEIGKLWLALEAEPAVYRAFYRLALLTGQRMGGKRLERGEILWMTWAEVDAKTHWWTIPGARTKNGLMHRVYLTKLAREQLAAVKAYQTEKELTSEYVFATPRSKTRPVTNAKHVIRRIRKASGLDFRPHDIRRTMTTMLTSHGVSRDILKRVINHTEDDVTAIYDRYAYDREKQDALQQWERLLKRIVAKQKKANG